MKREQYTHKEEKDHQQPPGGAGEENPIRENLQATAELHKHTERKVSAQQRAIEKATAFLGRPRFLFIILLATSLWMLINTLLAALHLPDFDPPPFLWLQGILSLGSVLMATMILITQNRQDQVTARNRHLDLQASLLIDQKVSKLIEMADEQRREQSPGKKPDPKIEAMKEPIDPHQVLSSLSQLLKEAGEETGEDMTGE